MTPDELRQLAITTDDVFELRRSLLATAVQLEDKATECLSLGHQLALANDRAIFYQFMYRKSRRLENGPCH